MPSTVLVTGGAGYVGSHTVLVLLQNNYDVIVLDNCVNCAPPSAPQTLPPSLERVKKICGREPLFYLVSMDDSPSLSKIFNSHSVDVVIHFAALKAVGESVEKPLAYYRNNLTATITLLEVMGAAGVHNIVFSSSATVYGTPQYLPIDEKHPVGQSITNPYGQTKHMSEQIMQDLAKSDQKWRLILLRYFNPVGSHESGLIGEDPVGVPNNLMPFIAQVAVGRRESLKVFGNDFETKDGTGVRDYIHVMDLAEGHMRAIQHLFSQQFSGCRAFNLGTGEGVSVVEMIKAFQSASGRTIKYEIIGRRAGDCAEMVACCDRAEQELQWKATRNLKSMCEDTWRWQSLNPEGYTQG